jgi:NTE family protein
MQNPSRSNSPKLKAVDTAASIHDYGKVVLVFQGGGALGAYQTGVYQALHEAGIEPDWIIGTSIGAINASLIAGNLVENRLPRLKEFWNRMTQPSFAPTLSACPQLSQTLSYWTTLAAGVPGFFEPYPPAFCGPHTTLGPERAGFYSTSPLEKTLHELIDFELLKNCTPRLTVGAAQVRTSQMRYFDSRDMELNAKHILASGALPPAFPPVRIEGELYWDGGILSNTPSEVVFDDNPRQNSIIFAVHMWNPTGTEPDTMWQVLHRHKDIQYSSRVANHIARQLQTHRLRHVIKQLVQHIPEPQRNSAEVKELANWGCVTQMHIVRLLSPSLVNEDHTKDIDFSARGILQRWEAGFANTAEVLKQAPWVGEFDPLEGVILHETAIATSFTQGLAGNTSQAAE